MIVQNNIKHINTIGLAAAKAAANPIVCRGGDIVLYSLFSWASYVIYLYNIYIYICTYIIYILSKYIMCFESMSK